MSVYGLLGSSLRRMWEWICVLVTAAKAAINDLRHVLREGEHGNGMVSEHREPPQWHMLARQAYQVFAWRRLVDGQEGPSLDTKLLVACVCWVWVWVLVPHKGGCENILEGSMTWCAVGGAV